MKEPWAYLYIKHQEHYDKHALASTIIWNLHQQFILEKTASSCYIGRKVVFVFNPKIGLSSQDELLSE